MSQFSIASLPQLDLIQRLLRMGRYVYCAVADEDLSGIIAKAATVLAGERDANWGLLMVDPETRPHTLPPEAPNRAQLRALAMRHGPWLADGIADMVAGLQRLLPDNLRPLLVSTYASEAWLYAGLMRAGFDHADTVVFYRLDLAPSDSSTAPAEAIEVTGPAQLRPASMGDTQALAELDAETFDADWHFGASEILEMQVRGRMIVAMVDGAMAGYSALLSGRRREAHLRAARCPSPFPAHGCGSPIAG